METPNTWLAHLEDQANKIREMQTYLAPLVEQARLAGHSWSEIGSSLGVSKQAAQQQYGVSPQVDPPIH